MSPVEDIKARLDIVEFIQSYIRLHKAGMNYKALCPFHSEKTPSFFVSPSRQIWHCFGGCGKGGDIFRFVMEIEGCDFPEALRLLAERAGIKLLREDPAVRSARNRLYDICESAARIFEHTLSLAPAVRSYLAGRGVLSETIAQFRIGFAPVRWDFLLKGLGAQGYRPDELENAGLVVKSEDGRSWYDRFRGRVMFPIADGNGRVIGFGGRIFEAESREPKAEISEAKYINTPQTILYDKSRVLYGLDKAKQEIRRENRAVMVEGYMDCVMSHQAGVRNSVAVSGTALTSLQLQTLKRLCDMLVFSFDADRAGESATRRSLGEAAVFEFDRRIAAIPSGKDPADTVREDPEAWRKAVVAAEPVVEFYFTKTFREHTAATSEGKKMIASLLLPLISELTNEIEKAHWIKEFSRRVALPEQAIWKELGRRRPADGNGSNRRSVDPPLYESRAPSNQRRVLLEERVVMLFSHVPLEFRKAERRLHEKITFSNPLAAAAYEFLSVHEGRIENAPVEVRDYLERLSFRGEIDEILRRDFAGEVSLSLRELEKECIRDELRTLAREIENKERDSKEEVVPLLQDFRALSDRLQIL